MAIRIFYENHLPFRHKKSSIKNWISGTIRNEGKRAGNINIINVSDDEIIALNNEYLKRSYATDVICFNYNEETTINGDIFIGVGKVISNAHDYGVNVNEEWKRVAIHGVLHLLGYDDKDRESAVQMREREDYYLASFRE